MSTWHHLPPVSSHDSMWLPINCPAQLLCALARLATLFFMSATLLAGGTILAQSSDINLYYPNPLASNRTFAPYSPQTWYEGGEFFKL